MDCLMPRVFWLITGSTGERKGGEINAVIGLCAFCTYSVSVHVVQGQHSA